MAIETTIYTPRTLGKLITRMPPVHTFFRDTLFKNRRTFVGKVRRFLNRVSRKKVCTGGILVISLPSVRGV